METQPLLEVAPRAVKHHLTWGEEDRSYTFPSIDQHDRTVVLDSRENAEIRGDTLWFPDTQNWLIRQPRQWLNPDDFYIVIPISSFPEGFRDTVINFPQNQQNQLLQAVNEQVRSRNESINQLEAGKFCMQLVGGSCVITAIGMGAALSYDHSNISSANTTAGIIIITLLLLIGAGTAYYTHRKNQEIAELENPSNIGQAIANRYTELTIPQPLQIQMSSS